MVPFTCNHCHFSRKVTDDLAGKKVKCPKCGGAVRLASPAPPGRSGRQEQLARQLQRNPFEEIEPATSDVIVSRGHKHQLPWQLLVVTILGLIGLGAGVYFFFVRDRGRALNPEDLLVVEWYTSDRSPDPRGTLLVGEALRIKDPAFVVVKAKLPGESAEGQTGFDHSHRPTDFKLLGRGGAAYAVYEMGGANGDFGVTEIRIVGADGKNVPYERHIEGCLCSSSRAIWFSPGV